MKLSIDLVPKSSWFNNVRAVVTKKQWDAIKSQVSSKAYNVCEICGGVGLKHPTECHEIWNYNNKFLIQKLEGMIALCPNCHATKHFGLSEMLGKRAKVLKHFMKINDLTEKKAEAAIEEAFKIWAERSKKTWKLDISHLETYGIDVSKLGMRKIKE